jgi:hypothetical protein
MRSLSSLELKRAETEAKKQCNAMIHAMKAGVENFNKNIPPILGEKGGKGGKGGSIVGDNTCIETRKW